MIQRCVNSELVLEDFAIDHGNQGRTKVISDLNKLAWFQLLVILNWLALLTLQILVLWIEGSIESRLQRVRIYYSKLLKHHKASCRFLISLVCKFTITEWEETILLREKVWQDFDQVVVLVLIDLILSRDAAIHENVTLTTMTMHVTEQHNLVVFVVQSDQLLCEIYCRVEQSTWIRPSSIQICPYKVAAVISSYHAIWIKHRYNLEDESLSQ